jgi:hypothetical protein
MTFPPQIDLKRSVDALGSGRLKRLASNGVKFAGIGGHLQIMSKLIVRKAVGKLGE